MVDYKKVTESIVGRHEEIKAIVAAMNARKHILLEGPPGTSKSTMLRRVAHVADIPFYIIEGNIDLTPAKLTGHFNPGKVMSDDYKPEYFEKGPLTKAMEQGGILYIEEFNRMPSDVANVLITPMEEGELHIPRYGVVKAAPEFIVAASQNPYDDVGTVRVSRAFMDRISLIKIDYQSHEEECEIVKWRTGCTIQSIVELAVKLVRKTRSHPEIKLGASVRGTIDTIDLYTSLQHIENNPDKHFLTAAKMALSNKIWLNETTNKTADRIIEEIWAGIRAGNILPSALPKQDDSIPVSLPEEQKKKSNG